MLNVSRKSLKVLALAALCAVPFAGCVSVEEYDEAAAAARTLQARNDQLVQENDQLKGENAAKQQRISQVEAENAELARLSEEMKNTLGKYQIDLNELGARINGMNLASLDPATNAELQALAAQYPDLMTYDGTRGMIRLAADLTFDSGSDMVKDGARSALGRLAGVLNDSNAGKYDIRIVGHTDRQPISNPATKAKFGTNRVLSCFRAISVEKVLSGYSVATNRMECSGWGEYQPAVESSAANVRANRRVEIFLVPSVGLRGAAAEPAANTAPTMTMEPAPRTAPVQPAAPAKKEMPFK